MSEASNTIRRFTQPLVELMVLNVETAGAILLRQNSAMGELVQAGVERARAVAGAKDVREALRLQQEYGREVFEKLSATGRDNWATVRDAYSKAGDVIRTAAQPKKEAA